MKNTNNYINEHEAYHAHIYFDNKTLHLAKELCDKIKLQFGSTIQVGNFHKEPIGPHPKGSCQITFSNHNFTALIHWLEENRSFLTIFIHALTGDNLKDHTDHVYWLGDSVKLNLAVFKIN